MSCLLDMTDVPTVHLQDLLVPMRAAVTSGQGLALLNGLSEGAIRELETLIWAEFADEPEKRVAVALRFRALLDVFKARRLKHLFLMNGFKLIGRAVREAASQRLNISHGFKVQAFVMTLAHAPQIERAGISALDMREAA